MDDYLRAILLGIIQAVTEFLPISSSGHLVLAPEFMGDEPSSLTFDVGLHVGTLFAVLAYFWRDWLSIGDATVRDVRSVGINLRRWSPYGRLGLLLALGTLPAVLVGLALEGWIDEHARSPVVVGSMLIGGGVLIGIADRWGAHVGRLFDMTTGRALIIGAAQAVALIPGVSRSGATMAAARALGFDRPTAARFSFLLSAPVVFGAGVLQAVRVASGTHTVEWGPMLLGAAVSAVIGALVIRGLLAFLQRATLAVFVWYRIALGAVVLALVSLDVL
ncbi:MAG: undecaprenyl-diphosphate phosphatase [Chloroflexi bacterium]|nr:undecaprenyl-diphosphate phosphatase [Chloroflexota bacterium]MQC47501.1 undecaprenyl-diphosphate phosphatase [Chloroflexota bacterium]